MTLVKDGRAGEVLDYLDAVDAGIFVWSRPVRFQGTLYRALNPIYAREPLSGRGAQLYGGRFNAKGVPALYTALSIVTAIKEASQAGSLQPTTLVSYEADIQNVFDTRDLDALARFRMNPEGLADNGWRDRMIGDGIAPTQKLAAALVEEGFQGLLVRSFARGATLDDLNLVLWTWGSTGPAKLSLIDKEGRLATRGPWTRRDELSQSSGYKRPGAWLGMVLAGVNLLIVAADSHTPP
jgi:RES domain-containing protein